MYSPAGSSGLPHSISQPFMRPICSVWVLAMSNANCLTAGSVLWSRAQLAMVTACRWCTDMSCANPTSTGPGVADSSPSVLRATSRPTVAPTSSNASAAAPKMTYLGHSRCRGGRLSSRSGESGGSWPSDSVVGSVERGSSGLSVMCAAESLERSGRAGGVTVRLLPAAHRLVDGVLRTLVVHRLGVLARLARVELRRVLRVELARAERVTGGADLRIRVRVALEGGDELVDALVVDVVDLQLVAPRLQRHRLVEVRVRGEHHERLVLDPDPQRLEVLALDLLGVVGDPHGAVLERVHHVLVTHRLVVHRAGARGPEPVVRAAERRRLVVGDALVGQHVGTGLVLLGLHAADVRRRVRVVLARRELLGRGLLPVLLFPGVAGCDVVVAEDAAREQHDRHDGDDGAPRDVLRADGRPACRLDRVRLAVALLAAGHGSSCLLRDRVPPSGSVGIRKPTPGGASVKCRTTAPGPSPSAYAPAHIEGEPVTERRRP